MKYLLDTDCCIYLLTDRFGALTNRVAACETGELGISAVSFAEIAMGSVSGKLPTMDVLDAFVSEIPLLDFDEAAARTYAMLPFRRARFDRLIAAHTLSLDLVLVTNNEADFADIPGLRLENWTK